MCKEHYFGNAAVHCTFHCTLHDEASPFAHLIMSLITMYQERYFAQGMGNMKYMTSVFKRLALSVFLPPLVPLP
eukprot:1157996-Pelagomonas_calceolata.AAC.2